MCLPNVAGTFDYACIISEYFNLLKELLFSRVTQYPPPLLFKYAEPQVFQTEWSGRIARPSESAVVNEHAFHTESQHSSLCNRYLWCYRSGHM